MSENKTDKLLQSIADEANSSVDFDALRASILAESSKRKSRQRGSFIRYASAAAVFVFVIGGAAIWLSRVGGAKGAAPEAAPMMMAAAGKNDAGDAEMYDMAIEDAATSAESAPAEAAPAESSAPVSDEPPCCTIEEGDASTDERSTSSSNGELLMTGGFGGEYAPCEGEIELSWKDTALFTLNFGKEYLVSSDDYCYMLTVTEVTLENFDYVCDALRNDSSDKFDYSTDGSGGAMYSLDSSSMKIDMTLSSGTLSLVIYAK